VKFTGGPSRKVVVETFIDTIWSGSMLPCSRHSIVPTARQPRSVLFMVLIATSGWWSRLSRPFSMRSSPPSDSCFYHFYSFTSNLSIYCQSSALTMSFASNVAYGDETLCDKLSHPCDTRSIRLPKVYAPGVKIKFHRNVT